MAVNYGVEIFLLPAAWPLATAENYKTLIHARANENQCYLISCNIAGFNGGIQHFGHSSIIDPYGISLASGGYFQCIVKGEIEIEELRSFRRDIPYLQHRVLSV